MTTLHSYNAWLCGYGRLPITVILDTANGDRCYICYFNAVKSVHSP